jgi:L-ascorbate metabolism protein UlaG (beta-lactamase superfamily)
LVDPWLVGSLTFGGLNAIYEGKKKVFGRNEPVDLDAIVRSTDAILLTMSIDDHCHRPTLQALVERRPDVPVVASPSAAALARSLGFTNVTSLDWAEEKEVDLGNVTVRATAGALVGPPWSKREAGFVVREKDGASLYYEPHCDFDANSVRQVGTVDLVVSPPNTQSLLGYDLVKGNTDNVALLSLLKPKTVIALMNAEFIGTGPLADLITERGGPEALKEQIRAAQDVDSDIEVVVPKSGEPLTLTV